ncbi:hypothetical protein Taro_049072 [Colocasia esculenta]|uniref:Pectinesterase n=1 Tax=Colocasia esculenta TaxID=4460 RepID=A0A843XA19_COLES|nr:hypothetical protein [Colocasia esculenta]
MSALSATLLLLGLHLLSVCTSTTAADASGSTSPTAACRTSVYPKLCRAVLAPLPFPGNSYSFGQLSIKQALKQARRTSAMLDRLLSPGGTARSRRIGGGAGALALEDCRQLTRLNAGYLEEVESKLGGGLLTLSGTEADHVRALMSALVTNQQTCFDGLQAAAAAASQSSSPSPLPIPEVLAPLANATQVYSVSLELVTSALSRKGRSPANGVGFVPGQHYQAWQRTARPLPIPSRLKAVGEEVPLNGSVCDLFVCHDVVPAGLRFDGRQLAEGDLWRVRVNSSVVVAKDGSGNFTTISDAIAAAPNRTDVVEDGYFKIVVREGVYQENVVVGREKKNLFLVGAGINRTVITGNRSVYDNYTTYNSATFAVHGERFIAMDITFENTAGPEKHQAVAMRNSADLSTFYRCRFMGYQDTLYAHSLRQFYRDCDVYGTIDFIFGNAASVFQNCRIYASKPMANQVNAVTAQGRTHPNQTTGFSIHNCTVGAAPDLAADPSSAPTYLGRPWKEYSRTVYMQSYIDGLIQPAGWLEWNGTFALSTLYYGEFSNSGPGANTSQRVQWPGYSRMDASEAMKFTVYNFTMGDIWLPYTKVPYSGGLLNRNPSYH